MKTHKLFEVSGYVVDMVFYDPSPTLPSIRLTEVAIDGSSQKTRWTKSILTPVPPYTKDALEKMIEGWLGAVSYDLSEMTADIVARFLSHLVELPDVDEVVETTDFNDTKKN